MQTRTVRNKTLDIATRRTYARKRAFSGCVSVASDYDGGEDWPEVVRHWAAEDRVGHAGHEASCLYAVVVGSDLAAPGEAEGVGGVVDDGVGSRTASV